MSERTEGTMDTRELDRSLAKALGYRVEEVTLPGGGTLWWGLINPDGTYGAGCNDHGGWSTEEAAWAQLPSLSTTWEGLGLVVEAMGKKGWVVLLTVAASGRTEAILLHPSDRREAKEWGDTAPMAVALKALGLEVPDE